MRLGARARGALLHGEIPEAAGEGMARGRVFWSSVLPLLSCCCWPGSGVRGCQHARPLAAAAEAMAPPQAGAAAFCPPTGWALRLAVCSLAGSTGAAAAPSTPAVPGRRCGVLAIACAPRAAAYDAARAAAAQPSTQPLRRRLPPLAFLGLKGGSPSSSRVSAAQIRQSRLDSSFIQ